MVPTCSLILNFQTLIIHEVRKQKKMRILNLQKCHFQVIPNLCFKANVMLRVNPLIWKWFFNLVQIKVFFPRKILHLALF